MMVVRGVGRPHAALLSHLLLATICLCLPSTQAHAGHEHTRSSGDDQGPRSSLRNLMGNMTLERLQGASAVVGVFSSGMGTKFANRRHLIRSTWGSFLADTRLQLVFVLPNQFDKLTPAAAQLLQEESAATGDLLILNNTMQQGRPGSRVLEFIYWARAATDTNFVIKVDEDVWLHPYHLQRLIATLPHSWQYWGLLQHGPDNVPYEAGWFVLLSRDMLEQVYNKQVVVGMVLDAWNTSSGAPSGLLLGQVLKHTPLTSLMLETYPAANYELYDWGPDKDPDMACEEADDGQPPKETIAVHALRRSATFNTMHQYFWGDLLRWKACFASQFEDPQRCQRVLNFELNM